jgi:transposase-like protein
MTTERPTPRNENTDDVEPVLTLIKQIKENRLDPAVLSTEDRRRCVDLLWSEGYTVAETAQILQRGERTIYRDRTALRAAHALRVHPRFPLEMAGELMRQAESSAARLRRIAREPGASAMERSMAENFAFKVLLDTIGKLQSMGYLPRVPTGVVAQVVGASGDQVIPTYDQLAQRLQELTTVEKELGLDDPAVQKQRKSLYRLVQRGRAEAEIDQMLQALPEEN